MVERAGSRQTGAACSMRTVDPELWLVRAGRTRLVDAPTAAGAREARLRASLCDAAAELWQCRPIQGLRYIQETENKQLR